MGLEFQEKAAPNGAQQPVGEKEFVINDGPLMKAGFPLLDNFRALTQPLAGTQSDLRSEYLDSDRTPATSPKESAAIEKSQGLIGSLGPTPSTKLPALIDISSPVGEIVKNLRPLERLTLINHALDGARKAQDGEYLAMPDVEGN
jgi:hypothetical protein